VNSKNGENKTGYESELTVQSKDLVEPQKIRSDQTDVFQWLKSGYSSQEKSWRSKGKTICSKHTESKSKNQEMSKGMPIIRDDKTKSIGRSAIKDKGTKYNMPTLPDNFDLDRQKAVQEAHKRYLI
jgi:hypothetical protein